MRKLIKGIFDVRAKWEHRGRASWSKLLLVFFVVQAQNRSGRPGHGFPGVREIKNTPKGLHFLSILRREVSHGYFPIKKRVWILLRFVLIRKGLEGLEDLCIYTED